MNEPAPTPWSQSRTGQMVINGVISGAVGAFIAWLLNNATSLPWLAIGAVFLGGTVAAFLVLSLARRSLRELLWVRPFKWLAGLRVTTTRGRAAIDQSGYKRRSDEIADERKHAPRPAWRVHHEDKLGDDHVHWLTNRGHPVSEVQLTSDPEFFHIDGDARFPGVVGRGSMVRFSGKATDRGAAEGVRFHATWIDQNGDQAESYFEFPPDEVQQGRNQALKAAHMRGVLDGRRLADQEASAKFAELAVPPKSELPLPDPRWRVYRADGTSTGFYLQNTVQRSVAKEVRLESEHLEFLDGAHWQDASGECRHEFDGAIHTHDSSTTGISVTVRWYDENASRRSEKLWLALNPPGWAPF